MIAKNFGNNNHQSDLSNFKIKKDSQIYLYDLYESFNHKKANEVLECGIDLWFLLKEHKQTFEQKLFLENMFTCKDRFCHFCNWRREMKYKKLTYKFIDELHSKKRLRYIFLTLTVPNCHISDLRATIQHMSQSFQRMKQTKRFKNSIVGYMRALEYTVQKDDNFMIHPHFHCMLAVEPAYFSPDRDLYINQDEFMKMWIKALRFDRNFLEVDIRVVKVDKYKKTRPSVIAEMIKYTMKDTDIQKVVDFEELTKQLKGVRTFNAGGILKGILKSIKTIDDDLVHLDDKDKSELWKVLERVLVSYEKRVRKTDYFEKKRVKLNV
jgi:plasmid rolling circle replication initiator protein Rep